MTPEEIPVWEPFLKRVPLFSGLSFEDISRIAARMQALSLPKGSVLFSQGDEPDSLYIITSGQVRLFHSLNVGETLVAFLGRGETLGEGGLLTGEPRSATARLNTTCEFLKLSRKDFEAILRETPSLLLHLSRILARRLVPQVAPKPSKKVSSAQLMAFNAALGRADAALFSCQLGLALTEQTRKRTLLVDMGTDSGAIARALGLKPQVIAEAALREVDLRDPGMLRTLAQAHPSGLEILSLPAATLGGRLYSGIYLFLNFLREAHDLVLVHLSSELGDIEKSVLAEADQALLVGNAGHKPQFRQLEGELLSAMDRKKMLEVWLGEADFEESTLALPSQRQTIPWSEDLAEVFERSASPYKAMEGHPKSLRGIERLARRLGGVQVGLALGAGAALGHSLIGVLKVFKKEAIPIDMLAGTSIGSLIGGFAALGMEPEEIEDLAARIDKAWVYENLFWDLTLPRSGIFAGETLLRFVRSYFGNKEFPELEMPFACVATDIETGEEVVLKEGRAAEAIRASCGLPLIYAPIRLNGRYLVDGGLVNPVPANVVADMGANALIAVNLTSPASERPTRIKARRMAQKTTLLNAPVDLASLKELALPELLKAPSMPEIFFQMIYTMEYEIAQTRLDLADVVIHPDLPGFSWTEMHRAKEIIKAGERVAEQYLPQIKALIPYFSDYCRVPSRK
ncbi:MAG: cyclic nucleotide-binding domain-containing protein [Elusimicrobia bacterium]|nr:cyclic nucleotide-binding domain-containing protein [Elusimicrobiota bacterium]